MSYYIQFIHYNTITDSMEEALGSDSVYPLDARLNLNSMIDEGHKQMQLLRSVQSYCGFKIMNGNSYTTSREVWGTIKS